VRRHRVSAYLVIAEPAQPATNRAEPADVHIGRPVIRDDANRPGDVTGGKGVIDRLFRRA
jgi:hypothetical protein